MNAPDLARQRQLAYRLLGSICLYPYAERLTTLRGVAAELLQESEAWADYGFADSWLILWRAVAALEDGQNIPIEEEYVRLFLAKAAAPPYESFYANPAGQARGAITVQLEQQYADSGLIPSTKIKEPSDHIAVELEFMAHLCALEAKGWEANSQDDITQALKRQQAFLNQHLGRWVPPFAERVRNASPDRLYHMVIAAIEAFIGNDQRVPVDLLVSSQQEVP